MLHNNTTCRNVTNPPPSIGLYLEVVGSGVAFLRDAKLNKDSTYWKLESRNKETEPGKLIACE